MRIRYYFIPLAAFILCALMASWLSYLRSRELSKIINSAGEHGWPIVVVDSGSERYRYSLKTLNGDSVDIIPAIPNTSGIDSVFFASDGTLHIIASNVQTGASAVKYNHMTMRFPNLKLLYDSDFDFLNDMADIVVTLPTQGSRFYLGREYISRIDEEKREFIFNEIWTQAHRSLPFTVDGDYPMNKYHQGDLRIFTMPSDNASVFGLFMNETPVSNDYDVWPNSSSQAAPTQIPADLYRYDIDKGEWEHIITVDNVDAITCNPSGKYVATWGGGRNGTINIIDIQNQAIVASVIGEQPRLSDRWAYYLINEQGQAPLTGRGKAKLIVLEITNDWKRNEIETEEYWGTLAIYEPPPNGLEGMYENYQPEK